MDPVLTRHWRLRRWDLSARMSSTCITFITTGLPRYPNIMPVPQSTFPSDHPSQKYFSGSVEMTDNNVWLPSLCTEKMKPWSRVQMWMRWTLFAHGNLQFVIVTSLDSFTRYKLSQVCLCSISHTTKLPTNNASRSKRNTVLIVLSCGKNVVFKGGQKLNGWSSWLGSPGTNFQKGACPFRPFLLLLSK